MIMGDVSNEAVNADNYHNFKSDKDMQDSVIFKQNDLPSWKSKYNLKKGVNDVRK